MIAVQLGPLALPVAPLLVLAAAAAAAWAARRLAARPPGSATGAEAATRSVTHAVLLGLAAARAGHVALHAAPYLAQPIFVLDLRDGGWHAPSGWAAGLGWLAWRAWRQPAWRRALAGAALAGSLVWGAGVMALAPSRAGGLPDLSFTALDDGAPRQLAPLAAGRPIVVNLWASWCGPCRREMPALAAAQAREPGVAVVFVNQGESEQAVRAYLASQGLALRHVLLDPGSRLGPRVGSRGLPTTLFYDARGRLVDAHMGELNAPALAARLAALRAAPG